MADAARFISPKRDADQRGQERSRHRTRVIDLSRYGFRMVALNASS